MAKIYNMKEFRAKKEKEFDERVDRATERAINRVKAMGGDRMDGESWLISVLQEVNRDMGISV